MKAKTTLALALAGAMAVSAQIGVAQAQSKDFSAAVITDARGAKINTELLERLKKQRSTKKAAKDELANDSLRLTAVRQEGLRVGAQAGLSERYAAISSYLDKNESRMNALFNFAPFVDGKLLMPAVAKTQDTFTLGDDGEDATVVRSSFTISEEARIISNPPTWHDWLDQEYEMPEDSHYSVLPTTPAEIKAWEDAISEGWAAGVTMADEVFSDRLAELTKSLEERYRYQLLLNQGVVKAPVLGVDRRSITYNGRTLNVGETVYTIDQPVNYTASPNWKPIWSK